MRQVGFLLLLCTLTMFAQNGELHRTISISPYFQSWSSDSETFTDFSEYSLHMRLIYPVHRQFSFALSGAQGETGGDLSDLAGITDLQLTTQYSIPEAGLAFSLRFNLPSGQKELTQDQLVTSTELANPVYRMRVPNFGQGLNIAPGFIWAYEASPTMAFGLGAAYKYNGKYKPAEFYSDFDPGDEITLTAGGDLRVARNSEIKTDIIYTMYSADEFNAQEVLEAGQKIVAILEFRQYFDRNVLSLFTRYRSRSNSTVLLTNTETKTIPNSIDIFAHYLLQSNPAVSVRFLGEMRIYEDLEQPLTGGTLFALGVQPAFRIGDKLRIPASLKFNTGSLGDDSLTGLELGLGLSLDF